MGSSGLCLSQYLEPAGVGHPQHCTSQPPRHLQKTPPPPTPPPYHTEMVVNGKLRGKGSSGLGMGRVFLAPRRSHGHCCTAQAWLNPLARAKGDGFLYSSTSSPYPQPLASWGQQWGSPWWGKAGKTGYGLEANPCCSWPQWCHCHPGGDPVQGMWGLHPSTQQPQ